MIDGEFGVISYTRFCLTAHTLSHVLASVLCRHRKCQKLTPPRYPPLPSARMPAVGAGGRICFPVTARDLGISQEGSLSAVPTLLPSCPVPRGTPFADHLSVGSTASEALSPLHSWSRVSPGFTAGCSPFRHAQRPPSRDSPVPRALTSPLGLLGVLVLPPVPAVGRRGPGSQATELSQPVRPVPSCPCAAVSPGHLLSGPPVCPCCWLVRQARSRRGTNDPACAACRCGVGGGDVHVCIPPSTLGVGWGCHKLALLVLGPHSVLGSQPVRLLCSLSGILPLASVPEFLASFAGRRGRDQLAPCLPDRRLYLPDCLSEGKRWTQDLRPAKAFLCEKQSNCLTPEPRGPGGTPGRPAPPRPTACVFSSISAHWGEPRRAAEWRSPAAPAPPWHILQVLLHLCPPRRGTGCRQVAPYGAGREAELSGPQMGLLQVSGLVSPRLAPGRVRAAPVTERRLTVRGLHGQAADPPRPCLPGLAYAPSPSFLWGPVSWTTSSCPTPATWGLSMVPGRWDLGHLRTRPCPTPDLRHLPCSPSPSMSSGPWWPPPSHRPHLLSAEACNFRGLSPCSGSQLSGLAHHQGACTLWLFPEAWPVGKCRAKAEVTAASAPPPPLPHPRDGLPSSLLSHAFIILRFWYMCKHPHATIPRTER